MVPPFLAFAGAFQTPQNASLLRYAVTQLQDYYSVLKDSSGSGLMQHITCLSGSKFCDPGLWATGNAWAAAGMVRVLATIDKSGQSDFDSERTWLSKTANTILKASFARVLSSGLLPNYLGTTSRDSSKFGDPASTALMAAAAYRLAFLGYSSDTVTMADKSRAAVEGAVDSSGWLNGCVNPLNSHAQLAAGAHSPEGQVRRCVRLADAAGLRLDDVRSSTRSRSSARRQLQLQLKRAGEQLNLIRRIEQF